MRKRTPARLAALAALLGLAPPVWANIGTPLMWGAQCHLVFGNLLIGLAEGALIARVWRCKPQTAMLWMIAANYASTILGGLVLGVGETRLPRGLLSPEWIFYHLGAYLILCAAGLFVATWLFEAPFCWAALRGRVDPKRVRARDALLASLVAQTLSYGVLIPMVCWLGFPTMITRMDRDPTFLREVEPESAVIYFTGLDGGVLRCRLDGSNVETVTRAVTPYSAFGYQLRASADGERVELWFGESSLERDGVLLESDTGVTVPCGAAPGETLSALEAYHGVDWRPEEGREWRVSCMWSRLSVRSRETHAGYKANFGEFLYGQATLDGSSVLPGDIAVFGMGDAVFLLDMHSRRIAYVTAGKAPFTVLRGGRVVLEPRRDSAAKTRNSPDHLRPLVKLDAAETHPPLTPPPADPE